MGKKPDRNAPENVFRDALKESRDSTQGLEVYSSRDTYAMDDVDKGRLENHMMAAHHKFMASHYRRKMHKKK